MVYDGLMANSTTSTSTVAVNAREVAPGYGAALVVLRRHKAKPFIGRHPWVFDTAIDRIDGNAEDGDIVELVSDKGKFIARGIFNSQSHLRVRLYTWAANEPLDDAFWQRRIEKAARLRSHLGYDEPAGAARLVYSEADGLSGLIVDRYGPHLVVQVNSLAMAVRLEGVVRLLVEHFSPTSVTTRSESGIAKAEGISPPHGTIWGQLPSGSVFIEEHGLRYGVDLVAGQKTGFYLDQRENRRAVAGCMKGRRVLDMFCFTGAFSLSAASLGGASEMLGIDSSEKAVALARANADLNGIANARFEQDDCFRALDSLRAAGQRFDGVILDPPKFTRTRRTAGAALQAYHRINRLAVELLQPDGILVTCSCSGAVGREDFLMMLSGVVRKTGRDIQVLEQRGASPDHPVSPTCAESEYLKCFICRVL